MPGELATGQHHHVALPGAGSGLGYRQVGGSFEDGVTGDWPAGETRPALAQHRRGDMECKDQVRDGHQGAAERPRLNVGSGRPRHRLEGTPDVEQADALDPAAERNGEERHREAADNEPEVQFQQARPRLVASGEKRQHVIDRAEQHHGMAVKP